jgi:hypothetical protein
LRRWVKRLQWWISIRQPENQSIFVQINTKCKSVILSFQAA